MIHKLILYWQVIGRLLYPSYNSVSCLGIWVRGGDLLKSVNTLGFALSAFARPYFGRERIEAYQLRKLKSLLLHAAANIPYYRELFSEHGIEPTDVRHLSDLGRIPVTGKQQLRTLYRSLLKKGIDSNKLIEHKTSGSTGIPSHILRSPQEERKLNLLRWRMLWMQGLRPGWRVAKVKTTWEPLSGRFNRLQNLARCARLLDSRVFDCFLEPAENARELARFQPHILSGYPGALVKIALQHSQQGGELRGLRGVFCGGESLAPHQRRILEECFGAPVHDTYGTTECNLAAWACPQTGLYHVCDDGIVLEICRDGIQVPPGQSGEVVITSLHSLTMPVIRHALGDTAVAGPSPCPCGSPFSTIQDLQGRIIDFLTLPDGRELHPFELLNEIVLGASDWISEYQLIQEETDRFRLLIVPRRLVGSDELARLHTIFLEKVGAGAHLQIEWVEQIPSDATGKFHFCRSLVEVRNN